MTNTQVIIKELPQGELTHDHFEVRAGEMPICAEDGLVVKTILMSIDAANRAWMQGATYREPVLAGDVMHTYSIAQVVESKSPKFSAGDIVATEARWAEYCAVPAKMAQKMPDGLPLQNLMSVYGIAGKTAYHGLMGVGRPEAGETVLVSAAAGSVGAYVGQIAKAWGCRAVGVAGGAEKCKWVVDELGFDACVDYRDKGFFKLLKEACPNGIDIYFDNVGGKVLETTLFQMNDKGRIVCCGAVSQYDGSAPSGPRNLPGMIVVKRLRMEGFIVMDFHREDADAMRNLSRWVDEGRVKVIEDVVEGIENAPAALIGLLHGENRGKRMVRVAPDPA